MAIQWRFNGVNIFGATQSGYALAEVQPNRTGGYQVVVSNALGTATSQIAFLTVTTLQNLFADEFESDSSSIWTINRSSADTRVTFSYDYSSEGIPPAPNSTNGTTRGVRFDANMTNGVRAAISISPTGKQFSGDYQLHFDLWMNANGPFPLGGSGSAQFITAGLGTSGDRAQWTNSSSTADGFWFSVNGEGNPTGSAAAFQDFSAMNGTVAMNGASGVYAAGTTGGPRDSTNAYYAATFPGQTPPLFQQTNYPNQHGTLENGTIGFKWRDVIISRRGGDIEWRIDGLRIALFTNVKLTSSNIFVGYWDHFNSISDNIAMSFGVVDNLRVEQVVTNTLPVIVQQPQDQTVMAGSNAAFAVLVGGAAPFSYQWQFNGTNISGATSSRGKLFRPRDQLDW